MTPNCCTKICFIE